MSSFRSSAGDFVLWNLHAKFRTYRKLSWMLRPFMKAFCDWEMSSFISEASHSASDFVAIFVMAWIKLIGRKSRTSSTPSFFDMRMMLVFFNKLRFTQQVVDRVECHQHIRLDGGPTCFGEEDPCETIWARRLVLWREVDCTYDFLFRERCVKRIEIYRR